MHSPLPSRPNHHPSSSAPILEGPRRTSPRRSSTTPGPAPDRRAHILARLPVTPEVLDATLGGASDGFVTELHTTNGTLQWSTYMAEDRMTRSMTSMSSRRLGRSAWPWEPPHPTSLSVGTPSMRPLGGTPTPPWRSSVVWGVPRLRNVHGRQRVRRMRQDHRIRKQILRMWLHGRRIPVTAGAYDTTPNGFDCFVSAFKPGGSYDWGTYLGAGGGSNFTEYPYGMTTDGLGNPVLCGWTTDPDFPPPPGVTIRASTECVTASWPVSPGVAPRS